RRTLPVPKVVGFSNARPLRADHRMPSPFEGGVGVSSAIVILRSATSAGRRGYAFAGGIGADGERIGRFDKLRAGASSGEERLPQDDSGEKQVPPCSLRSRVGMTS